MAYIKLEKHQRPENWSDAKLAKTLVKSLHNPVRPDIRIEIAYRILGLKEE